MNYLSQLFKVSALRLVRFLQDKGALYSSLTETPLGTINGGRPTSVAVCKNDFFCAIPGGYCGCTSEQAYEHSQILFPVVNVIVC